MLYDLLAKLRDKITRPSQMPEQSLSLVLLLASILY